HREQCGVEKGDDAAVGAVTDEPSQPLRQGEGGEGRLIVRERVAATSLDRLKPGGRHRITRRGERQLVDDDAAQRLAGDVHALPEAGGREQYGVRRRSELIDERRPR